MIAEAEMFRHLTTISHLILLFFFGMGGYFLFHDYYNGMNYEVTNVDNLYLRLVSIKLGK